MCFHQRLRAFTNSQNAQQNLTKKRETLVKAELASKSDRVKQLKDEVTEVFYDVNLFWSFIFALPCFV